MKIERADQSRARMEIPASSLSYDSENEDKENQPAPQHYRQFFCDQNRQLGSSMPGLSHSLGQDSAFSTLQDRERNGRGEMEFMIPASASISATLSGSMKPIAQIQIQNARPILSRLTRTSNSTALDRIAPNYHVERGVLQTIGGEGMKCDEREGVFGMGIRQSPDIVEKVFGGYTGLDMKFKLNSGGIDVFKPVFNVFEDAEPKENRRRSKNVTFDPEVEFMRPLSDLSPNTHSSHAKHPLKDPSEALKTGQIVMFGDEDETGRRVAPLMGIDMKEDATPTSSNSSDFNSLESAIDMIHGFGKNVARTSQKLVEHRNELVKSEAESHKRGAGKSLEYLQTKGANDGFYSRTKRQAASQLVKDLEGAEDYEVDLKETMDGDQLEAAGRKIIGLENMGAKKRRRRSQKSRRDIGGDLDDQVLGLSGNFSNIHSTASDSTPLPNPFAGLRTGSTTVSKFFSDLRISPSSNPFSGVAFGGDNENSCGKVENKQNNGTEIAP